MQNDSNLIQNSYEIYKMITRKTQNKHEQAQNVDAWMNAYACNKETAPWTIDNLQKVHPNFSCHAPSWLGLQTIK